MPDLHDNFPLSSLTALTPLDGRYHEITSPLATYLSEYSLIRLRMEIEASFLLTLSQENIIRKLTPDEKELLISLGPNLSLEDAREIKTIEKTLKHDVKAVEILLRRKIEKTSLLDLLEMIHFGLTSEDVNNLAYRLMLKRATEEVILPNLSELLDSITTMAKEYKQTPMLGRTHGQPAIPTTLGKELVVFATRLNMEMILLRKYVFSGKVAGAIGNYNALSLAFPEQDWIEVAKKFMHSLGLMQTNLTTQTNTYEDVISYFQIVERINNILIDFDQDMWRYISDAWFIQTVKKEEVGSSTMPQKVNPILFENSEGNLGMANAMIDFFVRKLPISRLQRDLSDSTVIRNFGSALGYSLLAYNATKSGLDRIRPNLTKIEQDLMQDWSILSEAVQTMLRKEGVKDPYTLLKLLTRGEAIDETSWKKLIANLPVTEKIKHKLTNLTPKNYIGLAAKLVDQATEDIVLTKKK